MPKLRRIAIYRSIFGYRWVWRCTKSPYTGTITVDVPGWVIDIFFMEAK